MFTVTCEIHDGVVLLPESHITRLVNTPRGIELHWRCYCGSEGVELTGALVSA